jgi:hypothetical protein
LGHGSTAGSGRNLKVGGSRDVALQFETLAAGTQFAPRCNEKQRHHTSVIVSQRRPTTFERIPLPVRRPFARKTARIRRYRINFGDSLGWIENWRRATSTAKMLDTRRAPAVDLSSSDAARRCSFPRSPRCLFGSHSVDKNRGKSAIPAALSWQIALLLIELPAAAQGNCNGSNLQGRESSGRD